MKKEIQVAIIATMFLMFAFMMVIFISSPAYERGLTRCAEDEVLVGQGDFQEGLWDRLSCVHVEEIVAKEVCRNPKRWYVEASACGDF